MNKWPFYLILIYLIGFSCKTKEPEQKEEKPNILWIIADDYSSDAGCFGTPVVKTPNIDQLCSNGINFSNTFATNPVCSPSRSALYTGMYQTTIGVHQHRTEQRKPLPDPVKVVTKYFQEDGYFTSNGDGTKDSEPEKKDFNFEAENVFDGSDWSQRAEGQPFFASVQIEWPHRKFGQDTANPVNPDNVFIPPYYPDHPVVRKDWAMYLESVQLLDQHVGLVLQRLKDEGLEQNTIVMFFADQGRPHVRGKQWLYDSGIKVPLIVRWPGQLPADEERTTLVSLIDIPYTSLLLAGIEPPEHLQGQDFLLDNDEREYVFATRNRTDAVVDHIRAVCSKEFKYIRNFMPERPYLQFGHYKEFRYPTLQVLKTLHKKGELTPAQEKFMAEKKPEEELYDVKNDPYEINNLATDPEYAVVLDSLRDALQSLMVETKDLGGYDPDNYDSLLIRREQKYGPRWKERGIDPKKIDPEAYLQWWEKQLGVE